MPLCPVCHEVLTDGGSTRRCGHVLCAQCMAKTRLCPVCREAGPVVCDKLYYSLAPPVGIPEANACDVLADILRGVTIGDVDRALQSWTTFVVHYALGAASFAQLIVKGDQKKPPTVFALATGSTIVTDLVHTAAWVGRFFVANAPLGAAQGATKRMQWVAGAEEIILSYAVGCEAWRDVGCHGAMLEALGFCATQQPNVEDGMEGEEEGELGEAAH